MLRCRWVTVNALRHRAISLELPRDQPGHLATSAGHSRSQTGREFFVPPEDATVVARVRAAGTILLGKTDTPEFTLAGGGIAGVSTTATLAISLSHPCDPPRSDAFCTRTLHLALAPGVRRWADGAWRTVRRFGVYFFTSHGPFSGTFLCRLFLAP